LQRKLIGDFNFSLFDLRRPSTHSIRTSSDEELIISSDLGLICQIMIVMVLIIIFLLFDWLYDSLIIILLLIIQQGVSPTVATTAFNMK